MLYMEELILIEIKKLCPRPPGWLVAEQISAGLYPEAGVLPTLILPPKEIVFGCECILSKGFWFSGHQSIDLKVIHIGNELKSQQQHLFII